MGSGNCVCESSNNTIIPNQYKLKAKIFPEIYVDYTNPAGHGDLINPDDRTNSSLGYQFYEELS